MPFFCVNTNGLFFKLVLFSLFSNIFLVFLRDKMRGELQLLGAAVEVSAQKFLLWLAILTSLLQSQSSS